MERSCERNEVVREVKEYAKCKKMKGRLTRLVTSGVGSAFYSTLFKGMIERTGRRGRRSKQLFDDVMGT